MAERREAVLPRGLEGTGDVIQIVMKPTPGEGVVHGETLYTALFSGEDVGLRVRGLRASHAEAKMMAIFRAQLRGKTVDYDLESYERSLDDRRKENKYEQDGLQ